MDCQRRDSWLDNAARVSLILILLTPIAAAAQICGEWTRMDPPAGATGAVIEVTAASPNDAWAFAYYIGLIRWDGSTWNQVEAPDMGGEYPIAWWDHIRAVGPNHLFMAGRGDTGPFSTDQILAIWDGTDWSTTTLTLEPDIMGGPRNGAAYAVDGAAIDDVWIVGRAERGGGGVDGELLLTVHWDGTELTEFITDGQGDRQSVLNAIDALATDDVWAVGHYNCVTGCASFHGQTYHWDGITWNHVPNPTQSMDQTGLNAVAAIATNDVWAAGEDGNRPIFLHWDGSEWSIVPAPTTTGTIQKMVALASDDVWAVDYAAQTPAIGKYYHWDGVEWSIVLGPEISGAEYVNRHGGMAAVGECDVWAVGSFDDGGVLSPYVERLQGGAVSVPGFVSEEAWLEVSPQPIRHSVRIRSRIPGAVPIRAQIFDSRGRRVRALFDDPISSGVFSWDGRDNAGWRVSGGVYFLRIEASDGRAYTQKLTVAR